MAEQVSVLIFNGKVIAVALTDDEVYVMRTRIEDGGADTTHLRIERWVMQPLEQSDG